MGVVGVTNIWPFNVVNFGPDRPFKCWRIVRIIEKFGNRIFYYRFPRLIPADKESSSLFSFWEKVRVWSLLGKWGLCKVFVLMPLFPFDEAFGLGEETEKSKGILFPLSNFHRLDWGFKALKEKILWIRLEKTPNYFSESTTGVFLP